MDYKYIKAFQYNDDLIKSYFDLTQRVFDFDLKDWRDAGYWNNEYIPHALVVDNRIVANVSAAIMKLQIYGNDIAAVQLGSVCVSPEYRGMGLSRVLTEKALEEYKEFPLIFLFANHSVLDYYPKFGFKPVREVLPFIMAGDFNKDAHAEKITLESIHLKRLLSAKLQGSAIVDARENPAFYWFHLLYNYNDSIYYIKEKDIVFLADYNNDTVDVYDVLSEKKIDFEDIKKFVIEEGTRKIRFHFTPDWLGVNYNTEPYDGDILHVLGMFPGDVVNVKFPTTGQT